MKGRKLNPKPSPDEVYEAYLDGRSNGEFSHVYWESKYLPPTDLVTVCDFFHALKRRHRGYKHETFFAMLLDMCRNWTDWNGYQIILQRGTMTGVCTLYKRNRDTIPFQGWKFVTMKPLGGVGDE